MARLRRPDPWGPLLAAGAVAIFLLRGFEGPISHDVALYAYSGQQLADGAAPYVAVLNRAGPLAHLVPGLGALAGEAAGVDELLAMRVTLAVVSGLCVWATYLLGRDAIGSRVAGAAAAVTLLLFEGFVTYATTGPREKTTMVLFMALALWLLCRRRWAATGVAIALATLTWQGAFFPLAAAALVVAVAEPGRRTTLVALARIAGGGLLVAVAAVAGFLAAGALPEFYEGFAGIHLSGVTRQRGLLGMLETQPGVLVSGFGWSLWAGVAGIVAALVLGVVGLRAWWRQGVRDGAMLRGIAAGVVVCLGWSLFAFQGWPDAFIFLPFAAVGVGGLVQATASRLRGRWEVAASTGFVTLALVLAATAAASARSSELEAQRGLARGVVDLAGPGATMQSIGAPKPLVLAGLRNPIRYQLFGGGLGGYLDRKPPDGLEGIADGIEERRPTFLVIDRPAGYPWLQTVLADSYRRLGNDGWSTVWFVTETMPRERVREMRALVRQGPEASGQPLVRRSLP